MRRRRGEVSRVPISGLDVTVDPVANVRADIVVEFGNY
jgi:hypothetical protein